MASEGPFMFHALIRLFVAVLISTFGLQGCSASPKPLDFNAPETTADRRALSEFYKKEAIMLRQKADEMAQRATAYRPLFGEESDWVAGARLLGEYYRQEAEDRQRLADEYGSPYGYLPSEPARTESTIPK
ncbi:MAG: hypothetical protein AB7V39_06745 [Nitrospiraceae bacterium]